MRAHELGGFQTQGVQTSQTHAHHNWWVIGAHGGQIQHRGGLGRAGTGVNYGVDLMGKVLKNRIGIIEWLGLAGRNQSGGDQRLAKLLEQQLRAFAIRYAQANGFA